MGSITRDLDLIRIPVSKIINLLVPCTLPVGHREIPPTVLLTVALFVDPFLVVTCAYAPKEILQWILASTLLPFTTVSDEMVLGISPMGGKKFNQRYQYRTTCRITSSGRVLNRSVKTTYQTLSFSVLMLGSISGTCLSGAHMFRITLPPFPIIKFWRHVVHYHHKSLLQIECKMQRRALRSVGPF